MSDRLSDDSVGMAALEHSGESTVHYESDHDRAPARVLPLRDARRGVSASGDGSDMLKHKFGKERRSREYGTPRGRDQSQVKALEGRLRKAERERLAATCEAAASMSSVMQQAETKIASVEASALEQTACLQMLAVNAEKEAGVKEQEMMRQMHEQIKQQAIAADRAISEIRYRASGDAADISRKEASMSNEIRVARDDAASRESAMRSELLQMQNEIVGASQRECRLASEINAVKLELKNAQNEVIGATQRECRLASEINAVKLELKNVQEKGAREREMDHAEARRVIEQVRHEGASATAKVMAEAENMQQAHAQERGKWEMMMKDLVGKMESRASDARGSIPQGVTPPPGIHVSEQRAFLTADGVLHRSNGEPPGGHTRLESMVPSGMPAMSAGVIGGLTVAGSAPGPNDPGNSGGVALADSVNRSSNDAINMLCGGAAPPPPPPPYGGSGIGCMQCDGSGHRGGDGNWRFSVHGDGSGGPESDGILYGAGVHFRRSEATSITIAAIPAPSQFRSWRLNTLREIAAASLTPDKCYAWVLRAESSDDLNETAPFTSIDGKIISALNKVLSGELLRQVQVVIEIDGRAGRFTSGRAMLRCVLKHFATSAAHGQLYDLSDLLQVRLAGNTPQALESFVTSWSWVEQGLRLDVADDLKASLLWEQLKDHAPLQPELLPYRISAPGDSVHTYAYLQKVMNKHSERTRQERTRAQVVAGLATLGGGQTRAYVADRAHEGDNSDERALASKICFQWQRGECR
eukprot:6473987-Amphidinium_carterae.1